MGKQVDSLSPAAALTSSANSRAIDTTGFTEAVVNLKTTAASGTTPTLDVKVQTSYDGSDWYDEGTSFTQITNVSTPAAKKLTNLGNFIRLVYTIGGTTPSFTIVANVVMKGKA